MINLDLNQELLERLNDPNRSCEANIDGSVKGIIRFDPILLWCWLLCVCDETISAERLTRLSVV